MKKSLFILIISLFLGSLQMNAQISIGVKAGYTNAWANYGDVVLPEDAEIDIHSVNISVLGYWKVNSLLQIGIEPGLARRGAACFPGSIGWGSVPIFVADTEVYLNYAELPLMSSWHLGLGNTNCEIYGKLGYGAAYLTSAFTKTIDGNTPPVFADLSLEDAPLNRWDHGIYSGLGFAYNLNKNKIFVNANYYYGFVDSEQFNVTKNRSIDLSLGYTYSF